ncbi:MAG TPA: ATP-binding protein [Aggregatilinea sp.]|jgi:signal transduction histidine kinase|uniref:hybrid sensor histidine kinase/response regulator n=1 Tax=Aggregatilinea sp. TaxID=2806333 RepID=UPI002B523A1E|nr:ATP-binding protein [Aggregatilinea sp.]HML23252.1 ATP-binding protein [Aggregatilinea sp.]
MPKILVIEDERILREEIVEWLQLEGYEAFGAGDGLEGVELAVHLHPDLVICDITMPRLDGYGVLLELNSNPVTAGVPFIFMTARVTQDDVRRGMSLGADDYIPKPFSLMDLLDAVESRLRKKQIQVQTYQQEIDELQKMIEREQEQRVFKARLVAMFSHDFRNPLSSIMSSNSLLRDYFDMMSETNRKEHFAYIEASVRQLLQMLDDMLLVSQMETGNLNIKAQVINVGDFLGRVVEEFHNIYRKTHAIRFENLGSTVVIADSRLLRQIAANLISNAVKYSPQGGEVLITVTHDEEHFTFSVTDQGIGIPQEDIEHLFEAFRRASNVGQVRGTGLGLAIVKQAVDLQGGEIHVQSEVNKGTTVTVMLPLRPRQDPDKVGQAAHEDTV